MSLDRGLHNRRSIRIPGYDYTAPGRYYVTVCTRNREYLFGEIRDGRTVLNEWGQIVQQTWDELSTHYPSVVLDSFVVMPNHLHAIIGVVDWGYRVGAGLPRPYNASPTLGNIVGYLKYQSAKQINAARNTPGQPVWQRNYYERIIRNEFELNRVRQYIADNPVKWESDRNNPSRNPPMPITPPASGSSPPR